MLALTMFSTFPEKSGRWVLFLSSLVFMWLIDIAIIFDGLQGKDIEGDANHIETATAGK